MFFILSKVLFFLVQPSTVALIVIAAGLVASGRERWGTAGRRLAIGGAVWLAVAGFLPVGTVLLLPLEERFGTRTPPVPEGVAGIILLGGFEEGWVSAGRGGLALNDGAERLTEGLRLARRLGEAKVVFSGGIGNLVWGADVEGPVREYLIDAGIAPSRIVMEHTSRNTYENGMFSRDILKPKAGVRWILVTSAFHMPRAVGVFRHAGFDVIPYPVDFRTRDGGDRLSVNLGMPSGLERLDLAAKEWIGLVAYWLTGKTSTLFPGPAAHGPPST